VQQEVILAMLAKEPSHGYELRARLRAALGPVGEDLNAGQVYVTLTRLEKAGLVTATAEPDQARPAGTWPAGTWPAGTRSDRTSSDRTSSDQARPDQSRTPQARPDRKVYELTPAGQQRVAAWLAEVSWPKPDLTEFHLKLIAAFAGRLADPIAIVDAQRRELLRRLRDAQRAALDVSASATPAGAVTAGAVTAGAKADDSDAALLLEGIVLRLQADLHWLEACERTWTNRRTKP
jgi:DNA-binding PadR family transcriptional regulator